MPVTVTIISGMSGSGKSTAIRALEDQGYHCVDNLPLSLLQGLVDSLRDNEDLRRLALVIDVRNRSLEDTPKLVEQLRRNGDQVRLVFLEAQEETLLRRFSETRRPHPLDRGQGLNEAMARERVVLTAVRELADNVIDTTSTSPHELRNRILADVAGVNVGDDLQVAITSFGFKYGLPLESDLVFDVRFLPNPYFVEELRDFTGLDEAVRNYVWEISEAQEFIERTLDYLAFLLPKYRREGKRYLTLAVGCTGGRHRSVSLARILGEKLQSQGHQVQVRHRDVEEK